MRVGDLLNMASGTLPEMALDHKGHIIEARTSVVAPILLRRVAVVLVPEAHFWHKSSAYFGPDPTPLDPAQSQP